MYGINKKGHILVSLGQFEDEKLSKQHAKLRFWSVEM